VSDSLHVVSIYNSASPLIVVRAGEGRPDGHSFVTLIEDFMPTKGDDNFIVTTT
jgi:hypothetical protein